MSAVLLRTLQLSLVGLTLLAAAPGWAQPEDPPGPDPLRVSLTTGFSVRGADSTDESGVSLSYGGVTPPPSVRLSAAWFFFKYFGLVADGAGEWFSVGPRVKAQRDLIGFVPLAYTWSGSVGAATRLTPWSFLSLEFHLGWETWGETQVTQNDEGQLTGSPAFHQGPYGTLALGVHPKIPLSFLGWWRWAPGAVHQLDAVAGPAPWSNHMAFGLEVAAGRLRLSDLRGSFVLAYEMNLRRSTLPRPRTYEHNEMVHNISLGVRLALAGPPVDEAPPPDTRPGSLTGTVVSDDGTPVWKAKVKVNGGPVLETDDKGQFSLAQVPAGTAMVEASAEGFKPSSAEVAIPGGEAASVQLALKRPTGPGKLKGKVLLADPDRPAAGAEVAVEGGPKVTAGDDGSYALAGVGPGPVALKFSATGYLPAEEVVQVPAEAEVTFDVKLSNKRPNAVLRGKVSAKAGVLVSATVTVKQKKLTVNVGADGSFSIELPGGRYDIVVEAPGFRTQTRTIDVGYGDQTIYHFELRPASR